MISLLFPQSPLCTAAIVFYTCVCIPLLKVKNAVGRLKHGGDVEAEGGCVHDEECYLSGVMFGEKEKEKDEEDICCPICLVEFEAEDAVSHLPRCAHLFHINCIETWLLRGNFTCPLCRSFVFSPTPVSIPIPIPSHSLNTSNRLTFSLVLFFSFCFFLHILGYM